MSLFEQKLSQAGLPQSSQMNRQQVESIARAFTTALLATFDANLAGFKQKGFKDAEAKAYLQTMQEVYGYSAALAKQTPSPAV